MISSITVDLRSLMSFSKIFQKIVAVNLLIKETGVHGEKDLCYGHLGATKTYTNAILMYFIYVFKMFDKLRFLCNMESNASLD